MKGLKGRERDEEFGRPIKTRRSIEIELARRLNEGSEKGESRNMMGH